MAEQEEVVLDSSVAVKWFSAEKGTERALEVRDGHVRGRISLLAPDLIVYEIANALRFRPGFDEQTVARAVEDLLDLQMDLLTPSRELIIRCSQLAFRFQITIYDSCYLGLGELMGTKVLTSDKRFFDRAKGSGLLRLL